LAGSGREGLLDAPLTAAALAQPSGIAAANGRLYFADSEASAVRWVDLEARNVQTIIGEGLFEFGDVEGQAPDARLQHPLGIAWHNQTLYVADTYNHKIKVVDPDRRTVTTLAGDGQPGWRDGTQAQFYEPGGLSGAGDALYVADTDNHLVRVIDLHTATTSTLTLIDPRGLLAMTRG
jgi:DNA-binding beta-propeller fold protein YncE